MANNHDRHFLDLMIKHARLYELALEECIKQFDYNNDPVWQAQFREMMMSHARKKLEEESQKH